MSPSRPVVASPATRTRRGWVAGRIALWLVFALFVCCGVYQAALVLDVIGWGVRGREPPGYGIVRVTFIVMVGLGVALVASLLLVNLQRDRSADGGVTPLLGSSELLPAVTLAALAVVVLGYYAPDPYYLNTGGSVADGGTVSSTRIVLSGMLAVIAATVSRFWPHRSIALTAFALWFNAATLVSEGTGH